MTAKTKDLAERAKPILFRTEMVEAILDGQKTMTRRLRKTKDSPPKYKCGTILYVRETWAPADETEGTPGDYIYRAGGDFSGAKVKWHSSMFMPKKAARIFLRITNVRCEPVQNITEDEAKAEGAKSFLLYFTKPQDVSIKTTYKAGFHSLWDSIHKKTKEHQWGSNPWVWAYTFERITP